MTTSALSPFSRQYSCACSTCRTSATSSSPTTRTSRIGQIAGNAVRPQAGLPELVRRDRVRTGPQRAIGEEHPRREALEQQRLVVRNAQMAQAALRVREGERERARGRARVAVLLRERFGRLSIRRDARGEREAHRRARHEPDPLAEAEDRIEHDARRAGQRAPVERNRVVGVAAAAEEARAIGLPFDRSLRPAFEAQRRASPTPAALADRAGADGRAAPRCRAGIRFRETACRTPDAPDRRPATPGRSPRSW